MTQGRATSMLLAMRLESGLSCHCFKLLHLLPEAAMTFIRTRLSVMMFLEFLIWGAWYPLIFGYLPAIGFDNTQQTIALACFNVAAIVAMFFSTQFADRNFASERFL